MSGLGKGSGYTHDMFLALATLVPCLILWALVCLAVYGTLRWGQRRAPKTVAVFGGLALVLQLLALGGLLLFFLSDVGGSLPDPNPPPQTASHLSENFEIAATFVGVWLTPLLLGATVVRAATSRQGKWMSHFCFSALFLALANGLSYLLFWYLRLFDQMTDAWGYLFSFVGSHGTIFDLWQVASMLLLWGFPLGMPFVEIAFNSFKRAHQINKTGSLD